MVCETQTIADDTLFNRKEYDVSHYQTLFNLNFLPLTVTSEFGCVHGL